MAKESNLLSDIIDGFLLGLQNSGGEIYSDISQMKEGKIEPLLRHLAPFMDIGLPGGKIGRGLTGRVMRTADELATEASPVVKGILGPIGRATPGIAGSAGGAKALNQAQKKIVKAIYRGDPKTLKDVVDDPRMMHVSIPGITGAVPKEKMDDLMQQVMGDAFAAFSPSRMGGTIRVHPKVLKGLDPSPRLTVEPVMQSGKVQMRVGLTDPVLKRQGVEGLPDMVVHEATHFLNEPSFQKWASSSDPGVARLAAALRPFIGHTKYGTGVVNNKLSGLGKAATAPLAAPLALTEGLSYLSQPTGRSPAATWLHQALTSQQRTGAIGQFDPNTRNLLQEALEAALHVSGAMR